jgi:hypothetical protein
MPELGRFCGMVIFIYFDDHPPPHFHVRYGSQRAIIEIRPFAMLQGQLTPRALALVADWAALRRGELLAAWDQAGRHEKLPSIAPLE